MNPTETLVGNLLRSTMSFWMVGKVEAPPKAKAMVPYARKNLVKVCGRVEWGAGVNWRPSITIWVNISKQENAVVKRAPTATPLINHNFCSQINGKESNISNGVPKVFWGAEPSGRQQKKAEQNDPAAGAKG